LAQLRRRVHDGAAPDGRGPLAIDESALFQLAVDLQRQSLDFGVGWQRKTEDAFQDVVGLVGEDFFDLGAGNRARDLDAHGVRFEPHRAGSLGLFARFLSLQLAQRPRTGFRFVVGLGRDGLAPAHGFTQASHGARGRG
jgi:hypothetical protein